MRLLVFPYGYDCEPVIRHAGLLEPRYQIAALVSPGGWGLSGKHRMLGDSEVTLPVYESVSEVTEEFDSLYIPAFEVIDEEVENRLANEIVELIPQLSEVICAAQFSDINYKKIKEACFREGLSCKFTDFSEHKNLEAYGLMKTTEKYPFLKPLDVPVVIVAGWWEKTDKFEISLALRERFLREGYRVSQIGSRDCCEMFGFHSFPGFMLRKDVDATDKIICFNRWMNEIAREEQPDLFLITIPGATQNYNDQFTRGFGILHHQVFQAVIPDALVMCTFYMPGIVQNLEEVSAAFRYRFGAEVDAFHMSNLMIDINDSEERGRIVTNSIYRENVSEAVERGVADSPIPVFNGLETEHCDKLFDVLLQKLTPKSVQAVL